LLLANPLVGFRNENRLTTIPPKQWLDCKRIKAGNH